MKGFLSDIKEKTKLYLLQYFTFKPDYALYYWRLYFYYLYKNQFMMIFRGLLIVLSTGMLTLSCTKMKNEVRVRNNYSQPVRVIVGDVDYGVIPSVKTTDYKRVKEGEHKITGDVEGSVKFTGRGKYYWTINVTTVGGIYILEDKKK